MSPLQEAKGPEMHVILIDNGSGYIWADSRDLSGYSNSDHQDAESAGIAAAKLIDSENGAEARAYEFQRVSPRDTRTGYHVYRVDIGGSEAVTVVHDGQDQETIDEVEALCDYVGFVTCEDASE